MTEEEQREFVKYLQTMRASAVTFRAEVVKREEVKDQKKQAQKSIGFDDLLTE